MPRVKSNVARLKRKNKVMKLARILGGRSKLVESGERSDRAGAKYAYRDRRSKKVEFRRWDHAHQRGAAATRCPTTSS